MFAYEPNNVCMACNFNCRVEPERLLLKVTDSHYLQHGSGNVSETFEDSDVVTQSINQSRLMNM